MHNYIWCPYYLPSFMKFCSVVSEELRWRTDGQRTPYVVVHITSKFWSPEFCGSYAPLNLAISRNLLLKQLVSVTPLKLLNRISWNLVGSKDTICSCAYYQEIWIAWILWELCLRWQAALVVNFGKFLSTKGHNSHKIQAIKIHW
jgi:hypothetical protein